MTKTIKFDRENPLTRSVKRSKVSVWVAKKELPLRVDWKRGLTRVKRLGLESRW